MSRNRSLTIYLALAILVAAPLPVTAQQRPDLEFRPLIIDPAFEIGTGPVVLIDEAHFNFHTAEGRYKPFAELLRRDLSLIHI